MRYWSITSLVCLVVAIWGFAPAFIDGKWLSTTTAIAICGLVAAFATVYKASTQIRDGAKK